MNRNRIAFATVVVACLAARPCGATQHLMQIEQVIGGLNGNASIQAIQLRQRNIFQNFVTGARLIAHDATGSNPVVLIAFASDAGVGGPGVRILAATSNFSSATLPALTPDFILTNPIPPSYLAAGSLTYEDAIGTVLWRFSWGGAGYTGPGTGSTTNDLDGMFNPQFADPMPSSTAQAVLFKSAATAMSTNNASDYALTTGAAIFTNNGGASATMNSLLSVDGGSGVGTLALEPPAPNPVVRSMTFSVVLPRETRVQLRILDVGGRRVRSLADQTMSAGRHDFTWGVSSHDGPAPPNGVYFLELSAGGLKQVRRFVLLH